VQAASAHLTVVAKGLTSVKPSGRLRTACVKKCRKVFHIKGTEADPIPLNTAWPVGGGWTVTVHSSTSKITVGDAPAEFQPAHRRDVTAPRGAEFLLLSVSVTYRGSGSIPIGDFLQRVSARGRHHAFYGYLYDFTLPAPNLVMDIYPVYSGQTVNGDICFEVASAEAKSLLLDVFGTAPNAAGEQNVWLFALRPRR
jgi:hypothetical protein